METPERSKLKKSKVSEETQSSAVVTAQCLLTATTASPKTPIRVISNLDDSYIEEVEQESPQFSHLIPISYNRRKICGIKDDDEDVRIGWDDGCGSAFFDYEYGPDEKCKRRLMRWSSNSLVSSTRQQTIFSKSCLSPKQQNTSPRRKYITNSPINNNKLETELNDYMGFVLSCLSAKTKNKCLKSTSEEIENISSIENSLTKNNINEKLNCIMDPADDELMFLCSQAIENMTEQTCDISIDINRLLNSNTETSNSFVKNSLNNNMEMITNNNYSSQVFLKSNSKNINKSPSGHIIKKFKQTLETKSINNNNYHDSNKDKNIIINNNGLLEEEDDDLLLSTIDLSAIEQQISLKGKSNTTNTLIESKFKEKQIEKTVIKPSQSSTQRKTNYKSSTSSGSNNLWRRSSSSSSIGLNNKTTISSLDNHQQKNNCVLSINSASISANKSNNNKICSAAEIQEKHDRARRTLLLKFKERNKSASFTKTV